MAHVRTYSPRVRVANWKEDVDLEEVCCFDASHVCWCEVHTENTWLNEQVSLQETLKNFILQKDRGELTVQKEGDLRQNILKPVRIYSDILSDQILI